MISRLLQHHHHFAPRGALLLVRDRVRHSLESSSSASLLGAKWCDLVRLHVAVLQELGNDGDVGGEVVVEAGFVGEGELGGLCGGSGLANQAEGDLVDGVGIIAGFGGPRYGKNCSVVR